LAQATVGPIVEAVLTVVGQHVQGPQSCRDVGPECSAHIGARERRPSVYLITRLIAVSL
jgi:hypothetical protein